jgi:hypothetical protein
VEGKDQKFVVDPNDLQAQLWSVVISLLTLYTVIWVRGVCVLLFVHALRLCDSRQHRCE